MKSDLTKLRSGYTFVYSECSCQLHKTCESLIHTASRASCGKEAASKHDYRSGISSDFDENQHRFKRDQYAENVGAGILKKFLLEKYLFFRKLKIRKKY